MSLNLINLMEELFMGCKNRFYVDIMTMQQEVTGSCNLIIAKFPDGNTIRFVVDCGLFQERKYEELNETLQFDSKNIDFCLVTHNHIDHTGRLPLMVKNGFSKEIFTTESTFKLLPYALHDSFKVLHDLSNRKHSRCLYTESDVDTTLKLMRPCKYNETIEICEHVKVTFFMNGHLMGASIILVQISYPGYEDINLLFTGDYNKKNMFFDVKPIPNWVLELPLTVIQESTYGDEDRQKIERTFKTNIIECISEEGTAVVLVFSLGRMQEILYEIKIMQETGELSSEIPIYLDGKLGIKYTQLYIKDGLDIKDEMRDFLPKNLTYVDNDTRAKLLENSSKKIIITTSGMGSYGPAQTYIPEYITRENVLIQFTGYTAEGTLGHNLKNAEHGKVVHVAGLIAKKMAEVEYTTEYSAHAKADEMIAFLKQFHDLKLVLINHGEEDVKNLFAERVVREVEPKRVGVLGREYFFRVNHYGLMKSMATKFN